MRIFIRKKIALSTLLVPAMLMGITLSAPLFLSSTAHAQNTPPATPTCSRPSFLGLKPWYQYLPLTPVSDPNDPSSGKTRCVVNLDLTTNDTPNPTTNVSSINKLWLIGIVIFEDLLRVAGLVAVIFIIYGGIRYTTSQGEPEHTKQAQSTIINALIGLAITIIGATVVAFIGNNLGGT